MEYTVNKRPAETYLIRHNEYSWGIFFLNADGDLFIESDWGYWTFSWRAWGPNGFKAFLCGLDEEYFFGKLLVNHNQWGKQRAKVGARTEKAVKMLFKCLQAELKKELEAAKGEAPAAQLAG